MECNECNCNHQYFLDDANYKPHFVQTQNWLYNLQYHFNKHFEFTWQNSTEYNIIYNKLIYTVYFDLLLDQWFICLLSALKIHSECVFVYRNQWHQYIEKTCGLEAQFSLPSHLHRLIKINIKWTLIWIELRTMLLWKNCSWMWCDVMWSVLSQSDDIMQQVLQNLFMSALAMFLFSPQIMTNYKHRPRLPL